jgi:hypothetical protein
MATQAYTAPEKTSAAEAKADKAEAKPAARTEGVRTAGESGDPVVHQLLAEKQGHQMNRDLLDPPVVDPDALEDVDEKIADIDEQLADLGFPQESQADRKKRLAKEAEDADKAEDAAEKRRSDRADARAKRAEARKSKAA